MPGFVYIELRDNPGYHYSDVLSAINYNFSIVTGSTGGGSGSTTYVRPGSNVTTGGTAVAPIVNVVASPSFNNLTFSGTGQFAIVNATTLSGGTLSGGTIYSGTTNLSSTIISLVNSVVDITRVRPGSNVTTGGTGTSPIINIVDSPSFNVLTLSGAGQFAAISATSVSAGIFTRVSGSQILFSEFNTTALHGDITYSTSAIDGLFRWAGKSRFASLSATTFSADTINSGTTNLYNIFQTLGSSVLPTAQVAFGSAASAITSSTGFTFSAGSVVISSQSSNVLTVAGSGLGQQIFTVQGSQGELFSVTDSLSGSLFSVNNISGLPVLEVFSDNTMLCGDYLSPALLTTKKTSLTSGTNSIYAIPISLYDGAFIEYTVSKTGSGSRVGHIMMSWSGINSQYTETSTIDIGTTTAVSFSANVISGYATLLCSASTSSFILKTIIRAI